MTVTETATGPDRLDLSIADDRIAKLREAFPEVFRDGAIDFDALQRALGAWVDPGKERFGLTWPGKAECMRLVQQPSVGTLVPDHVESVDFDTTRNLVIEGENLEVLKILQRSYYGKVKMIYIDPPYNTGGDFVYPDNFSEGLRDYLRYSGQIDEGGLRLSSNTESEGRYHSKWLSMMHPRLFLARNLLRNDGVIFVSIDDHEQHHLRAIMAEIFGEENFIESFVWKRRYGGGAKEKYIVGVHEYVVMYAKCKPDIGDIYVEMSSEQVSRYYKLTDERSARYGPYRLQPLEPADSMADRPNLCFPVVAPDGSEIWPRRQWLWGRERFKEARANGILHFAKKDDQWSVSRKQYLRDPSGSERLTKQQSIIDGMFGQQGTAEIDSLFGDSTVFPFSKPSELVSLLMKIGSADDLVLDFFAGSGATAHAVLRLNQQDGGKRRFILVQLPEPTSRQDYPTVADVTRERVRRVIGQIQRESKGRMAFDTLDLGFRSYRLTTSNFKPWTGDSATIDSVAHQIELFTDNLLPGRSADDILTEIMLKLGFELTAPVERLTLAGKEVFSVAGGALLVCLDRALTLEVIEAMATREPAQIICLDAGFNGNDQLKVNAVQTIRTYARGNDETIVFKVV